jgi:hypothetical protein
LYSATNNQIYSVRQCVMPDKPYLFH